MTIRWWQATAVAGVVVASGCGGRSLPSKLSYEGASLEKANSFSISGVSGVVFVPPGEKLETASLQVGVLLSDTHASGAAFSRWVMEQYRRSPTTLLYEGLRGIEWVK